MAALLPRNNSDASLPEVSARLDQLLLSLSMSVDEYDEPNDNSSDKRSSNSSNVTQTEADKDSNYPNITLSAPVVTLKSIQATMSTISGYLGKQSGRSSGDGLQWTDRYLMLAPENGSLYLFGTDTDPDAQPISILKVSAGFSVSSDTDVHVIRVHGISSSSSSSSSSWTLKCKDQQTKSLWLRAITRIVQEQTQQTQIFPKRSSSVSRFSRASAVTLVDSPTASPIDATHDIAYSRRGSTSSSFAKIPMSRSNSTASTTSRAGMSSEEREALARQQHQQYLAMKEAARERIQKELAIKKEKEEREKRVTEDTKVNEAGRVAAKKVEAEKKKKEQKIKDDMMFNFGFA
ncbi:UNVERIFIED_CONTAM: hypothetical protein HDU68_012080 [Siphonaria sp. JEL0065]|nr:hypothetical protein HDU68_012080 [Siphonaria sp. JEL0065]